MTTEEHLVENAIIACERGGYEEFLQDEWVQEQIKETGLPQDFIWTMAQYVVCTYKPVVESETIEQMVKEYGYRV